MHMRTHTRNTRIPNTHMHDSHATRSPDATHRFMLLVHVGHAKSDTKLRPGRPYKS